MVVVVVVVAAVGLGVVGGGGCTMLTFQAWQGYMHPTKWDMTYFDY